MTNEYLRINQTNGIATLTLDRPDKHNAMNGPFVKEMLSALQQFAKDDAVSIVVIHANGANFCAGADVAWMRKIANGSMTENYEDAQLLADMLFCLYTYRKPTIVLAQGATFGGGMGLIAAADIAIAAKDARFALPEVKIGMTPSVISPYIIEAIGSRFARYYFLTGERFDAEVALRMGFVHQVAEKDALFNQGLMVAENLMANGPKALQEAKQLIRYVRTTITEPLTQKTAEHLATLRAGREAQEGLKAFLEKRKPIW